MSSNRELLQFGVVEVHAAQSITDTSTQTVGGNCTELPTTYIFEAVKRVHIQHIFRTLLCPALLEMHTHTSLFMLYFLFWNTGLTFYQMCTG